jgi:lipoprotein-releasing system ATP-binding protein
MSSTVDIQAKPNVSNAVSHSAALKSAAGYQGPVVQCNGLAKIFEEGEDRVEVLTNVNLTIQPRERIAIVGVSGSGKSTLLHLLGGLDQPTKGEVLIAGEDIIKATEKRRSELRNHYLGFVYQFHHLLPEFTVLENVCMPLLVRGTAPAQAKEKAMLLLDKVQLTQRYRHKLGELSGGERQRTAIVRALVTDPLCVLADEPTGNLDQHTAGMVYDTMLELNTAMGTSLIIVTHDMQLASRMDRMLTIKSGVVVPIQ